jgi:uncharacterized protein YndB with AHSA1/START domain
MTKRSVTHATFIIERVYDATPAQVFKANSDQAIKRRWFAEGEGFSVQKYELDFRVGGLEACRFRHGEGAPMTYDAMFQDIVPEERIICAYSMTIGGNRISSSLATTQLRPEGRKTRLIFTEQGAYLDGHDNVKEREEGSRGLLEALAKEVAKLAG